MEKRLMENKTIIITGGATGIGKAITELFANNGYNVLINYYKSKEKALNLQHALTIEGFNINTFKADVSKQSEVNEMVKFCLDKYGRIDVLVNNAGITYNTLFDLIKEDEWNEVIDINLKGTFLCCQAVVPFFLKKKEGIIINISSIWGIVGAACEVHYSAAKAGLIGFTKALAKELGPSNIRVNCVAPGIIATDMLNSIDDDEVQVLKDDTPLQRLGTVDDIAQTILFLSSEKSSFITGQVLSPNGGFVI